MKWLAQGTIYPDVIESAGAKTKKAHTINKTPTSAGCRTRCISLLEPLRELSSDEVRARLALTAARMVYRHPLWSRPGRAHPRPCHASMPRLRRADAIFIDELRQTRRERQELVRPDGTGVRRVPAGALVGVMGTGARRARGRCAPCKRLTS